MGKHTPGPWEYTENLDALYSMISSGNSVVAGIPCLLDGEMDELPTIRANARLIAAAPDLLAALKAFDEGLKDGSIKWAKPRRADSDPYHRANTLMCAAIARAEGK